MSFSLPVLLAPLVAGYVFSVLWNASYYQAAREDGQRIYFRAAFYAFFLGGVATLLHIAIVFDWQWGWYLTYVDVISAFTGSTREDTHSIAAHPVVFLNTLPISIGLGGLLSVTRLEWIVNMPRIGTVAWWWERLILDHATKNMDFERIVTRAFRKSVPILVTLNSFKVYAGWVVAAPSPVSERRYLRILPVLSGYRDATTHALEFTTEYAGVLLKISEGQDDEVYHLDPDDLEVVVPVDQVSSVHLFDLTLFQRGFPTPSSTDDEAT